jgi:translation initiation factor IF-2
MSDAETGDEGQKEDGGKGKTLSLKRTVESGQVRQSFSHGRSKSVLVEKRRKRIVKPGQEGADSAGEVSEDKSAAPAEAAPGATANARWAFQSRARKAPGRRGRGQNARR